jgi:hypothetical protein
VRTIVTAVLMIASILVWCRGVTTASVLDYIDFGLKASEEQHLLKEVNTKMLKGALGEECRVIGPEGSLEFELTCDPAKQNYLTVKFWGSDTGNGMIFVLDPVWGELALRPEYQSEQPELDYMSEDPAFPGRFYYSTYIIPEIMVIGQKRVKIKLVSTGQATPYSTDQKVAQQAG